VKNYPGTMRDIPSAIQAKSEPEYRELCALPFDPAKGSEGLRALARSEPFFFGHEKSRPFGAARVACAIGSAIVGRPDP